MNKLKFFDMGILKRYTFVSCYFIIYQFHCLYLTKISQFEDLYLPAFPFEKFPEQFREVIVFELFLPLQFRQRLKVVATEITTAVRLFSECSWLGFSARLASIEVRGKRYNYVFLSKQNCKRGINMLLIAFQTFWDNIDL